MTLATDHERLKTVAAQFFTHYENARQRIADQRRGLPASANLNGSGGGGSVSPVERALELGGANPDQDADWVAPVDHAAGLLDELDRLHAQLTRDPTRAARIVLANTPQAPTAKQRDEVTVANDRTCEHCTRWVKTGQVELVHRTGDVAGNLKNPDGTPRVLALGQWCYGFVRSNGRLPSKAEVERHADGLVVRVRL